MSTRQSILSVFFGGMLFFYFLLPAHASVEWVGQEGKLTLPENKDFTVTTDGHWATDFVSARNTIDLDNKNKKDTFGYIGSDYRLNLDLKYLDDVEVFFGFERFGPFGYDAPILGRTSVPTSAGNVEHYRNR